MPVEEVLVNLSNANYLNTCHFHAAQHTQHTHTSLLMSEGWDYQNTHRSQTGERCQGSPAEQDVSQSIESFKMPSLPPSSVQMDTSPSMGLTPNNRVLLTSPFNIHFHVELDLYAHPTYQNPEYNARELEKRACFIFRHVWLCQ